MNLIDNRIQEIKNNGYELDFGNVFEYAFENYKKIALYAGLILIVFFVFLAVFMAIVAGTLISLYQLNVDHLVEVLKSGNFKPETLPLNYLLIYYMSLLLLTCIISPFLAGFLKMADCGQKDEEFNVATIFEYYKKPYFQEIILATFLITLSGLVISTLLDVAGLKIIGLLISYAITFCTFLTIPFIVFGKLKAIQAISTSVLIVAKQPLLLLALLLVTGILSVTGMIGLCIGIVFTYPIVFSMNYSIYNSIIGIDNNSDNC